MKMQWTLCVWIIIGANQIGCTTPIAQHKAAESFAKAYSAYADMSDDFLKLTAVGRVLEIHLLALEPGDSIITGDLMTKKINTMKTLYRFNAQIYRLIGQAAPVIVRQDETETARLGKSMLEAMRDAAERMPEMGFPVEKLQSIDGSSLSPEQLKDRLLKGMTKILNPALSKFEHDMEALRADYYAVGSKIRDRALAIVSNRQENISVRMAAVEKYSVGMQIPLEFDDFATKIKETTANLRTVNEEFQNALKNPKYTLDDYRALMDRLDKSTQDIERAVSIVKRIIALVVLL